MKFLFRLFLVLIFATTANAQVVFNNGGGGGSTNLNLATLTNTRLGEFFYAASGKTEQGLLPVVSGTVINGAIDYPLWSAMYPNFVVGNDIVFPTNVDGMFLRNVGGNAGAEGALQADGTAVNGLSGTVARTANNHIATEVDGGGGNNVRFNNTTRNVVFSSTDPETRPVNRAYQLYTVVDGYTQIGNLIGAPVNPDTNCEVLEFVAGVAITSTNGETINPGDYYISCPQSGTTWMGGAGANYASANLASSGARTHSWGHNQIENFTDAGHERNYDSAFFAGLGMDISETAFNRDTVINGNPGISSDENLSASDYDRNFTNGADQSTLDHSGSGFKVEAQNVNTSTQGTSVIDLTTIPASGAKLEWSSQVLPDGTTVGIEAKDVGNSSELFIKTGDVGRGTATVGQVLGLSAATGEVEFVDVASSLVFQEFAGISSPILDGVSNTVWTHTDATAGTILLDSTPYDVGARIFVTQGDANGTLAVITPQLFLSDNELNAVTGSITIEQNESLSLIKDPAGNWIVTSQPRPQSVDVGDVVAQLRDWTQESAIPSLGLAPIPVPGSYKAVNSVSLEDLSTTWQYYSLFSNIPTTTNQVVRVKWVLQPGSTTSWALRLGSPNTDITFDKDTGLADIVGAGITVLSQEVSNGVAETYIEMPASAGFAFWQIYPAFGVVGAGTPSATQTGTVQILELDLNADFSAGGTARDGVLTEVLSGSSTGFDVAEIKDVTYILGGGNQTIPDAINPNFAGHLLVKFIYGGTTPVTITLPSNVAQHNDGVNDFTTVTVGQGTTSYLVTTNNSWNWDLISSQPEPQAGKTYNSPFPNIALTIGATNFPSGQTVQGFLEEDIHNTMVFKTDGTETFQALLTAVGGTGVVTYLELNDLSAQTIIPTDPVPAGIYSINRIGGVNATIKQISLYKNINAELSGSGGTLKLNQVHPVNVTASPVTVVMPAGAEIGDTVTVIDSRFNALTNNITVDLTTNGYVLYGTSQDLIIDTNGETVVLTYTSPGAGWTAGN